ncbi:MAG: hypothetical protein JST73_01225 [Actinobacteria bacterium]|nr:hypothetical protein [Actinomycetota bacterium]
MVLGVLAIVWVVVLGGYARERMGARRTDSVSAFHSQLSTLQRTQQSGRRTMRRAGTAVPPPGTIACDVARRRRRDVLTALVVFTAGASVLALISPGPAILAIVAVGAVATGGYIGLLVRRQRLVLEQRAKVRPIAAARRMPASAPAATRLVSVQPR